MAQSQPQGPQAGRGASQSNTGGILDQRSSPKESQQLAQHYNVAGVPLLDLRTAISGRPVDPSSGAYYDVNNGDGISQFSSSGQYRPNFRDTDNRQTHQDQTHYLQTQTSDPTPIDFPPGLQTHLDLDTISDSELFWVQYQHGANIGRDLFPRWRGLQTDDLPPRETLRLIPNEERSLPHLSGKLQIVKNESGELIRSELTDEYLYELPFLPRYIDMKTDASTKNIDNWIIMGADLRRDIIPRCINYNPYHSFDENGDEFFDWRATAAHLQRTYTNKHMKRAEQPHVMGGLLRKFRMDKGRFAEFLTPITFDEQGNQRRMLLNMENLLFNTRWDIDLDRMVMKNPHSHQELPLFTPVEVRPQVRECLERMLPHERVPTLRDLFKKHPHVSGYDERKHPLFRRSEELDTQLRRNWEMEAARRGLRRPPVTVTKPNYAKGRKEFTAKRKRPKTSRLDIDTLEGEGGEGEDERPSKRDKRTDESVKPPPRRRLSTIAETRTKRPPRLPPSPLLLHPSQYAVEQSSPQSTYLTYQDTPMTASFHEVSPTQTDLLLQPMPESSLIPEELLYHPPIDCLDENGVFVQILISQYYTALTPENRQLYRNIRETQGFDIAKQRLLETFAMQEMSMNPTIARRNGPGMMPDQFAPMTGDSDAGNVHLRHFDNDAGRNQPHFSQQDTRIPIFGDTQEHDLRLRGETLQFYDPQLVGLHPDEVFTQTREPLFSLDAGQALLSPWSMDPAFDSGTLAPLAGGSGESDPQSANMSSLDDNIVDGLHFSLDSSELDDATWGQYGKDGMFPDDSIN